MEQSKNKGDNLKLFMKIGFISDFLIDLIDNLAETKDYKHNLKFHLNKVLEELTKHNNEFYNLFNEESLNTDEVKNIDIYNIISNGERTIYYCTDGLLSESIRRQRFRFFQT